MFVDKELKIPHKAEDFTDSELEEHLWTVEKKLDFDYLNYITNLERAEDSRSEF